MSKLALSWDMMVAASSCFVHYANYHLSIEAKGRIQKAIILELDKLDIDFTNHDKAISDYAKYIENEETKLNV